MIIELRLFTFLALSLSNLQLFAMESASEENNNKTATSSNGDHSAINALLLEDIENNEKISAKEKIDQISGHDGKHEQTKDSQIKNENSSSIKLLPDHLDALITGDTSQVVVSVTKRKEWIATLSNQWKEKINGLTPTQTVKELIAKDQQKQIGDYTTHNLPIIKDLAQTVLPKIAEPVITLSHQNGSITNIAITNNRLVTIHQDHVINIWDYDALETSSKPLITIPGVCVTAITTYKNKIISSEFGKISIWDPTTATKTFITGKRIGEHTCSVKKLLVKDNLLISVMSSGEIKVWDLEEQHVYNTPVYTLDRTSFNEEILVFKGSRLLCIHESHCLPQGKPVYERCLEVTWQDLCQGGEITKPASSNYYNLPANQKYKTILQIHYLLGIDLAKQLNDLVFESCIVSDDNYLIASIKDGPVMMQDILNNVTINLNKKCSKINCLAVDTHAIVAGSDHTIEIWNLKPYFDLEQFLTNKLTFQEAGLLAQLNKAKLANYKAYLTNEQTDTLKDLITRIKEQFNEDIAANILTMLNTYIQPND